MTKLVIGFDFVPYYTHILLISLHYNSNYMVNFFFFLLSFWHLQSPKWVHSLTHLNIDPPPVRLNNWSKFNLKVQSEQAN